MISKRCAAAGVVVVLVATIGGCKEKDQSKPAPAKTAADQTQAAPSTTTPQPARGGKTGSDAMPSPAAMATSAAAVESAEPVDKLNVKGVAFVPPGGWAKIRGTSSMRAAEFSFDGEGEADLVVFHFGPQGAGSREANVQRWIGQFADPSNPDAKTPFEEQTETLNGLTHTVVRVSGEYRPGPMAPNVAKEDYSLFGVIVEGGPEGPLYVKAIGLKATIEAQAAAIREFYRSAVIAESSP